MSKKKKIVLVIAVLLIIGAGVGFYFYNKKKQAEAAPETTTPGILPNTPITPEEQVKALFREILGREADQVGLEYWTTFLKSSTLEEVRKRFYASPEYLAKTKVA